MSAPTGSPTSSPTLTCSDWGAKVSCPNDKLTCTTQSNSDIYKCSCPLQDCYYIQGTTTCTCNDPVKAPSANITVGPATMPPVYNIILTNWELGGICASSIVFITIIVLILLFFRLN